MTIVADTDAKESTSKRLGTAAIGWITFAWATLVIAVLAWQTYAYSGVIAFLAEWQFRNFDRFFPIATIALLTALLVLPFVIVLMIRLRRMAKDAPPSRHEIIRRQTVGRRFTQVLSIGSFAAALIVVVIGVSAPGLNEKPAMLSAANPPQQDFSGLATLRGGVRLDRIGYYRERFVFVGRDLWVAPVLPAERGAPIRYFVQVERQAAKASVQQDVTGYLKAQALPGGLRQLYANAGFTVNDTTFVVFKSKRDVRWPWYSAAGQLALLGLLSLLFWLVSERKLRKLKRSIKGEGHIQR